MDLCKSSFYFIHRNLINNSSHHSIELSCLEVDLILIAMRIIIFIIELRNKKIFTSFCIKKKSLKEISTMRNEILLRFSRKQINKNESKFLSWFRGVGACQVKNMKGKIWKIKYSRSDRWKSECLHHPRGKKKIMWIILKSIFFFFERERKMS